MDQPDSKGQCHTRSDRVSGLELPSLTGLGAGSLEEVAADLLRDESLRGLPPDEAAREWLARGAFNIPHGDS